MFPPRLTEHSKMADFFGIFAQSDFNEVHFAVIFT